MSAVLQEMTPEQFLEWEDRQQFKYEFDGLRVVAMTGVTQAHAVIQSNLMAALHGHLRGTPCRVVGSELKVKAGASYRYPDALIFCGPIVPTSKFAHDPVSVFEILSNFTATTDRITKNFEYRATPSIQRYILLEQGAVGATVFARTGDAWVGSVQGPDSVLDLPEAGISVPLEELYDGLAFGA